MSKGIIEHRGIVKRVSPKWIEVTILAKSACAGCHLKGTCGMSDQKEKYVDIPNEGGNYKAGDAVHVWFKESSGFKALFLGYLLPFLIMLGVIIGMLEYTGNEAIAALSGLGILVPYYFLIYLNRDKVQKAFHFHIRKEQPNLQPFANFSTQT